jgi:hypothetical protein
MQSFPEKVRQLYNWIDHQLESSGACGACGRCCDFENFGHKLYITSVELKYFAERMPDNLKPMTTGICPYRIDGKCSVYEYRFAGCRIFACGRDETLQSDIMEQSLKKLKQIGTEFNIPYNYTDLKIALKSP